MAGFNLRFFRGRVYIASILNTCLIISGSNGLTDDHWEQYNKICHTCLIDYDFIGKFDSNMVDDIA